MRHAVIIAGGAGTRLWPLSRRAQPKPLLRLFDGKSLLRLACERLTGLFDPARTWVVTSTAYLDRVAQELPDLPRENLIGEPVGRDTANAIGLAASLLALRDPDATMAVFTADHLIRPQDRFAAAVRSALDAAERFPDALVTFGVPPAGPHTGYGYVRRGEQILPGVFRVREFREKPSAETARGFVESREYYWNSGMFAWRLAAILGELQRQLPQNADTLRRIAPHWSDAARRDDVATQWLGLRRVSIDYGVMEHAATVLVVELACEWLDVGSFEALAASRPADARGNVVLADRALLVDAAGNIVVAPDDHLVAILGAEDLVVVHTPDATLVCRRDHAQRLRELAEQRIERFGDRFE